MRNASNCVYIPLQDGVYIRSIYLEGAGWDKRGSVLIEPAPMQLICNMPVIHFRPAELLRKRTRGKTTTKYRGWNIKITVFSFPFLSFSFFFFFRRTLLLSLLLLSSEMRGSGASCIRCGGRFECGSRRIGFLDKKRHCVVVESCHVD